MLFLLDELSLSTMPLSALCLGKKNHILLLYIAVEVGYTTLLLPPLVLKVFATDAFKFILEGS